MSTATTLPSNINSPKTTKGAMRPAVTVQKDSSMIDETSHNRDIARELGKLEAMFHIDQQKLKQIVKRFEQELDEGLQQDGKNIPMAVTWVLGLPHGREQGSYLAIDLGGTNIRICWITLLGGGRHEMIQHKYRLPQELKTGTADELWDSIAYDLEKFVSDNKLGGGQENPLPLAFTFSYPATQHYIDHGILQRWTKGFDIDGCEGHDAAEQLGDAIRRRNLPIRVVALVNDTTGAMIASAYNDPDVIIGAIFGTGCNAAYMDDCGSIPKLPQCPGLSKSTPMAINCEYGAFDNDRRVLPLTPYDEEVDRESPRPGQQMFEKMSAGLYLGEVFRLVLLDLHKRGYVFRGQDVSRLVQPYTLDTGFISDIEDDFSLNFANTRKAFEHDLGMKPTDSELIFCHRLSEIIAERGARLSACGIAAICARKGIVKGHVAADGSVANKHPKFKTRWATALGEILDWPADRKEDPIIITSAEDGSGVGAAIIAAMTLERKHAGNSAGIRGKM